MADEVQQNVKIRLESNADTSGFKNFEGATRSLTAAKREASESNLGLVESERRVRSNLEGFVKGLSESKDATSAVASSISHLSEVFNIGFGATVIAGVGSSLIEQFGKADEAIDATAKHISSLKDEVEALKNEIEGIKVPESVTQGKKLDKLQDQLDEAQDQAKNPGFFGTALIGAENILGTGDAERRRSKAVKEALQGQQGISDAKVALIVKDALSVPASTLKFSDRAAPTHAQETEFELQRQNRDADTKEAIAKDQQRQKDEAQKAAERAAADAAKKKDQEEKAAERAAALAAKEAAKEANQPEATLRAKLNVVAGSSRALGGGGGVFSTIRFDPVVEEARKHTALLTDISNTLKSQDQAGPEPALAA